MDPRVSDPSRPSTGDGERHWLARCRAGDPAAFQPLLRPHLPALLALAKRHCRDPHWAEDLVQETLVRAFRNLPGFRGDSALRPRSRAALGRIDPGWVGEVPDAQAEPEQAGSMDVLPNPVAQALQRRWAVLAAREALEHAKVAGTIEPERLALILGTNLEDRPDPLRPG